MCTITTQKEIIDQVAPLEKGYKNTKRLVRQSFFENIKTEIQAYLLGFYVADGSLNDKRNTLRIHITESDKEIIDLFRDYISPDARVARTKEFDYTNSSGKTVHIKESIQVDISNKKLAQSLRNLGYGENKTYKELPLPKLGDELIVHFIRGYFDGDGCFTAHLRTPNPKNREKNYRISMAINFVAKNELLLTEISNFLTKFGIDSRVYYVNSSNCYRLYVSSKSSVKAFFDLIYKDCNFFLRRKFDKFNHHVNTEVTQLITEYRNA
jgi:intein/homing endonuclease